MCSYAYSPLIERAGLTSIRLLRILPNEDDNATIECQLINYVIPTGDPGIHLYEALSYVWGNPDKTHSIMVDGYAFGVTTNLFAALSHLRNRYLERSIWTDAICINQTDLDERGQQIRHMARIYGVARSVIVWLGDASDGSDEAIEAIRLAADNDMKPPVVTDDLCKGILALLERPWFRRIWVRVLCYFETGESIDNFSKVLQEVAAARHITVIVGNSQIDGYTFCSGLQELQMPSDIIVESKGLFQSVADLIVQAIIRPRSTAWWSNRISLEIGSLTELLDMYHLHHATERHDKVFALIGMASDNGAGAKFTEFTPDYNIPWSTVFESLFVAIFGDSCVIKIDSHGDLALIKAKGYIYGRVLSVETATSWGGRQYVLMAHWNWNNCRQEETRLGFGSSATRIMPGDFICFLEDSQAPMIVRPCRDYFNIVKLTALPIDILSMTRRQEISYDEWWYRMGSPSHPIPELTFVWDWNRQCKAASQDPMDESLGMRCSAWCTNNSMTSGSLVIANRLTNTAVAFAGHETPMYVLERMHQAMKTYKATFQTNCEWSVTYVEALEQIYECQGLWGKDEQTLFELVQARSRLQRVDHPDTGNSLQLFNDLATQYENKFLDRDGRRIRTIARLMQGNCRSLASHRLISLIGHLDGNGLLFILSWPKVELPMTSQFLRDIFAARRMSDDVVCILLDTCKNNINMNEDIVLAAAANDNNPSLLRTLIEKREDEVTVTAAVVETAASNPHGVEMLAYLMEKRAHEVRITQRVIIAVVSQKYGMDVLSFLLQKRRADIEITEDIVVAAAANPKGEVLFTHLLKELKNEVIITAQVTKAAASSPGSFVQLLLERNEEVKITEEIIILLAKNPSSRGIEALVWKRIEDVKLTEANMEAAAGNSNIQALKLLLREQAHDDQITEVVLKAAARNTNSDVMAFILTCGLNVVKITEGVMMAAVQNYNGEELLEVLSKYRLNDLPITNRVKAVAQQAHHGLAKVGILARYQAKQHSHSARIYRVHPYA